MPVAQNETDESQTLWPKQKKTAFDLSQLQRGGRTGGDGEPVVQLRLGFLAQDDALFVGHVVVRRTGLQRKVPVRLAVEVA